MKDAAIQLQVKLTSTAKDFLKLTNKPGFYYKWFFHCSAILSFLLFGTILLKEVAIQIYNQDDSTGRTEV